MEPRNLLQKGAVSSTRTPHGARVPRLLCAVFSTYPGVTMDDSCLMF